ncbi:MAG: acyl-CoA dehydrogenase family protein [Tuberibacillus sp.]
MEHPFARTSQEQDIVDLASSLANLFKENAAEYDKTGEFPHEHFKQLAQSGYGHLTIPSEYGGKSISLKELVLAQETLAMGDPATTLGVGWHLGVLMDLAVRREWNEGVFERLCRHIVENGVFINRAMTENQTGNPTRGGRPHTKATKVAGGWEINGHKTFTTLSPIAEWFIVTASVEGTDEVAGFLVNRHAKGVSIKNTWDTIAMRPTGSEDLLLENVFVEESNKVETIGGGHRNDALPPAWLLHIPACYVGMAYACLLDTIEFAKNYQPNSLAFPIKDVPRVRDLIGEMQLELYKARFTLYGVAEAWDNQPERRSKMGPELSAAKTIAVQAAARIIDLALNVVGGQSIYRKWPFERYYRDILAGRFNPPSDDSVYRQLAALALDDH